MNKPKPVTDCDPLHLVHSLVHGGKALEARIDALLAGCGLSSARWHALRQLAESDEGLSLGQLAEHLSCVRSNVTQLVDRLEAEDLVQRVPDPGDRRSVRAQLTLEGRARLEAGRRIMREFEQQLLSEIEPEERHVLAKVLSRLESQDLVRS